MSGTGRRSSKRSRQRWYSVLAAIGAVVLVGGLFLEVLPSPTPPASLTPTPSPRVWDTPVPRIDVSEAREQLESGSAVMIDVRSAIAYAQVHIPGALSIPVSKLAEGAAELPKDKNIILY